MKQTNPTKHFRQVAQIPVHIHSNSYQNRHCHRFFFELPLKKTIFK